MRGYISKYVTTCYLYVKAKAGCTVILDSVSFQNQGQRHTETHINKTQPKNEQNY